MRATATTPELIDPEDLISPREAARMLHVVPRTIINYREEGLLDYVQINHRRFLYSRQSILRLLTSRKHSASDPIQLQFFS